MGLKFNAVESLFLLYHFQAQMHLMMMIHRWPQTILQHNVNLVSCILLVCLYAHIAKGGNRSLWYVIVVRRHSLPYLVDPSISIFKAYLHALNINPCSLCTILFDMSNVLLNLLFIKHKTLIKLIKIIDLSLQNHSFRFFFSN